MPAPRNYSPAATGTVRAYLGLSQQQLADWLGVTVGFVNAVEKGRKGLSAALLDRLLVLVRLLPAPRGSGPPAPPPLPAEAPVVAVPVLPLPPVATDPLGLPDPAPLRAAARVARRTALAAERELVRLHARAVEMATRRRGLALLQAAPPPPEPAEAARWASWLAGLAADLAYADPHPGHRAAARHRLTVRAAAHYAEATALEALAAAAEAAAAGS